MLKKLLSCALLSVAAVCLPLGAQTPPNATRDPLDALHFLEGGWAAHSTGQGATSEGTYSFLRELKGHVLARHGKPANCQGPASFDCEHGDLLYVFQEAPGQPLKALYLDNEGHVIHYDVTVPEPGTAIFLSEPAGGGPRFRLTYTLRGEVLSGKFQMQLPGQTDWRSYLEWSGGRKSPGN